MALDENQVERIVDAVVRKLSRELGDLPRPEPRPTEPARGHLEDRQGSERRYGVGGVVVGVPTQGKAPAFHRGRKGIFDELDSATSAARAAYEVWNDVALEDRARVIEAMREVTRRHAEELARMAVEETKLGNVKDKISKNLLCANKTPGIEILRPTAWTGDHGLTLLERAPFGVIGSITPTTNPTETIINNSIGMLAGGNSVVFNVHPSAKKVSAHHIQLINEAIVSAGGPENLVCGLGDPTIDSAQALMKHKNVRRDELRQASDWRGAWESSRRRR
jgi:acyl-CoA reductase-like NAD-dependent aldehyde dehydrogenase